MTEQQTDPEAARVQSIGEQLASLKDEILTEVKSIVAPLQTGGKVQQGAADITEHRLERGSRTEDSLESMVDAAVNKVVGARDAQAADDKHRAQHEALEAAQAERPPMERTRRHRWMGWGEPSQ